MLKDHILGDKIARLPHEPGVYLMKDQNGKIIYVGKARNLHHRVLSYFSGTQLFKTQALVEEIADFDIILTNTEIEALLTERTLIKHHDPRFNVRLRDDKEFPYIRVDEREEWPRLERVRRIGDDGARYVGPFGNSGYLNMMLKAIARIFPLIRCSRHEFETIKRPCMYYDMKMCLAPCHMPVDRQVYLAMVKNAVAVLQGRSRDIESNVKRSMEEAAEREQFELAAQLRDQHIALRQLSKRQSVIIRDCDNVDAIGLAQGEAQVSFYVMLVREGKLLGSDSFVMRDPLSDGAAALGVFLMQYYENRDLPEEILVSCQLEEPQSIIEALRKGRSETSRVPKIFMPARGPKLDLMDLALKNAEYALSESRKVVGDQSAVLASIQEKLHLKKLPIRVECIDISNFQNDSIVASDVCFVNGKPAKEFYRRYTIRNVTLTPDDYSSISEVVHRRLERALRDDDLPDLLIIDGGRGQLHAACDSLAKFPGIDLAIVSLAKARALDAESEVSVRHSDERVFMPGREHPVVLEPGTPEFRFFTQIRDEAHRFAITFHRSKRDKKAMQSELDDIMGVGPKVKQRLLLHFGSVGAIKSATLVQLEQVVKKSTALEIFKTFHSEKVESS